MAWTDADDEALKAGYRNAADMEQSKAFRTELERDAAARAAVNSQVYNSMMRSGGGGNSGSGTGSYTKYSPAIASGMGGIYDAWAPQSMSADQWDILNSRPSGYNEENIQYWNNLIKSVAPGERKTATWGTAEDQELRQETQKLAKPYINAYLKDINDYNSRMIGQMGYVNPYQAKTAMSAKTGQLGTNIDKTLATSSEAARRPIQSRLDAQNQAYAQNYQSEMAAYQALLNAIRGGRR